MLMAWLIFCSIMIAFVSEALIREGFGKAFTAKVAGWSMLAAIVTGTVPSAISEFETYGKVLGPSAGELNASANDRQSFSWKPVKTVKILPDQPQNSPHAAPVATSEVNNHIDFTTICGAGEEHDENRLDIAGMNKKADSRRC